MMDRDQVWHAIDAERLRLADLLDQLSEEEWRQPSLCSDWTVREVAAHLTLQQVGLGAALAMFARSPGRGGLLLGAGRLVALPHLSGAGAAALTARLSTPARR